MPSRPSSLVRSRAVVLALALVLTAGSSAAAYADSTPSPAPTTPTASPTPDPAETPTETPMPTPAEPPAPASDEASPAPQARLNAPLAPAETKIVRQCAAMPGGARAPGDATYFNYPYSGTAARNNIRYMVLRAINSTPGCDMLNTTTGTYAWNSIQIAAYSLNDNSTVDALIRAKRRGVQVKVIGNSHNISGDRATQSPSFKRLMRTIGSSTRNTSWARVCSRSCRGSAGNHHYKMYTFSHTGSKRNVTMAGSANLTLKAAGGQWNHLDVYTDAKTFATYRHMFTELAYDRAQAHPYREYKTSRALTTWFFPRPGTRAANDPMVRGLRNISCRGSAYNKGRTIVRIGMYAWYEERGLWMAQAVRRLWNAGCDVAIEYAVMGNNVKKIVYSPSGRGRIPMRQVATYYRDGTVANYDHQKYVTVLGRYAGNSKSAMTWTGTTNWSNLGLYSDDLTQVWSQDFKRAAAYRSAFYRVWRGLHTRVPSPTSKLPGKVGKGNITFGKGKYKNLENN